jgi:DinB superfamily
MTTLIATDLEQARQCFAQARTRVLEAVAGVSEVQSRFKPAPDRWSIVEILEHMAIVHERVLDRVLPQLSQGAAPGPDRDCPLIDALVVEKIPDRSITAKAPDFIQPTGRISSTESLDRIFRNHERFIEFLESTPDLREHVLDSPPLAVVTKGAHTTSDGYQWALTAAAHDERHVRQIEELKANANYPA